MNKGDFTNDKDSKAHPRKGRSLLEFNANKIFFKSCRKFKIYFLLSKLVVCPLPFKMEWCDSSSCTAKVWVIRLILLT